MGGRHASHLLQLLLLPLAIVISKDALPGAAPHALFMEERQDHDARQVPHACPEETARAALVALEAPEPHGLVDEPGVDGQAGCREGPLRHAGGAEAQAQRDEDDAVAERDARVARGVGPREHAEARGLVLVADGPAEGHEVRELPGEQEAGEQPAADGGSVAGKEEFAPRAVVGGCLARGRRPSHQGRDASYQGADPGVECGDGL